MTTVLLYSGIDEMLEPAELSRLLGRHVDSVSTEVIEGLPATTDATFVAVSLDGEPEPSLMVKQAHPAIDWVALCTRDEKRRAVRLWSEGVFERLPSEVETAVIACGEWADGYGILMWHLGAEMLEFGAPLPAWMDEAFLDAMAALHASYWEDVRLADRALGLCTVEAQVRNVSPLRVREVYGDEPAWPRWIIESWEEALPEIIDPGLVRDLQSLIDDPLPIATALAPYPKTLVHGDLRLANVGLRGSADRAQCHFIDWGRAAFATPALDLGWYLGFSAIEWQADVDERIATYEGRLRAHLGDRWPVDSWERQREIGLLAGLLQSIFGCRAYWGVRQARAEGHLEHVETEVAALRSWASRLRNTLDLL